tara:strand:+ start:17980 stop:18486 length:507 start_codon:yes stop_codon:yes gene_type:complete
MPNAVCVLTTDAGFVVLVRDKSDQRWTFPGGGLDPGERAHEACLREFREEAGFPFPDQVPYSLVYSTNKITNQTAHFFFTIEQTALVDWAKHNNGVDFARYGNPYNLTKNPTWKAQTKSSYKEMDRVELVPIMDFKDSVARQSSGNGGVQWPVKQSLLRSIRKAFEKM